MRQLFDKVSLLLIAVILSLSACALDTKRYTFPAAEQIIWPAKPAKPRIKYIGSFSSSDELGIEKSFFTKLAEFFIGQEEQRLIRPMAVLAPDENEIYVADPGIKGVHYFNLEQGRYMQIRLPNDYPLPSPVALTVDGKQRVLVADSALGQIFRLNLEDGIAEPIALKGKLKQPTGLAYSKKHKSLFVVDTASHSVKVFDQQGQLQKEIGRRGDTKGKFNYPTFLWQDSQDDLWVTDSLNFRVQRFSAAGRYLGQFGKAGSASGTFSRPKGVATDDSGHVYVVDSLLHALQIFDKKGRLLLNIGQQGHDPGEFWLPTGIYIGENSKVYIADSHNQRIQVFQYIGDRS